MGNKIFKLLRKKNSYSVKLSFQTEGERMTFSHKNGEIPIKII
jgi:hypothetical protein